MIPWKRNKRNSRIIRKLDGGQIRLWKGSWRGSDPVVEGVMEGVRSGCRFTPWMPVDKLGK
jgi:hypothetical protein